MAIDFVKPRAIIQYLFDPDRELIASGNVVFLVFCVCAGVLAGSATSLYVIGGMFFSAFHIWRGVVPWQNDRAGIVTASTFAAFFLAELLANLVNPGGDGWKEVASNLTFLGFFPIYSLLVADRERSVAALERAAAIVAVIAAIAAIFSPTTVASRVELAAGNPGVAAVLGGVLYLINLIAVFRQGQPHWRLSIAGAAACVILLLLTGMRSLWPCLFLLPLIVAVLFGSAIFRALNAKIAAATILSVVMITALASNTIQQRIEAAGSDLQEISKSDYTSSLGVRVLLWSEGKKLILEQPLLGYGPGNVVAKIQEANVNADGSAVKFTHFHNVVVNELVRAGLVGLITMFAMFFVPLYFVVRAPKSEMRSWALAMLSGLHVTYFMSGVTGIMIGHDILDTLFIVVTALCLYLVRPVAAVDVDRDAAAQPH
ncbi:MAG: O-antigen ligase family protein [Rhizobiaceae bacterium]